MSTQVSKFWSRWLLLVILGIMAFGLIMVLTPQFTRQLFGLLFYNGVDALDVKFGQPAIEYITLVQGVLGTVMLSWGCLMLMLVLGPFRRRQKEGWRMLTIALIVWYLPDTAFSLWTGFWQNAILNTVIALMLALPLVATYKAFNRSQS